MIMRKSLLFILFAMLLAPLASAYGVTFYSPTMNPQYGLIFEKVIPDKPYVVENTKGKDVAITKVTFTIDREASNAGITVYHLMAMPEFLPQVGINDSYEINELKYSGFVPHDTKKVIYDFRVAKAWLETTSVPRNQVALHFYDKNTESWDELATEITGDDDTYVYFRASGVGYHYLMVGKSQSGSEAAAKEIKSEVETVEEKPSSELSSTQEVKEKVGMTAPVEQVKLDTTPQPVASTPAPTGPDVSLSAPEEASTNSAGTGILILLAVAVAAVIIYLIAGRRKLGTSVDKELHNYIGESLNRGKTKEEVRRRLLDVGWHQERVEKALSKHKDAVAGMPESAPATAQSADVEQHHEKPVEKTVSKSKSKAKKK